MKRGLAWLALLGIMAAGCGDSAKMPTGGGAATAGKSSPSGAEVPKGKEAAGAGSETTETPATGAGEVALSPDNARIVFVCAHVGEKPDPRIGGFKNFSGKATFDPEAKELKSVVVDIDTKSIWTKFPDLTSHLKKPDFFDSDELPKASFKSTAIEVTDAATGAHTVTGDLTLHGVTKPVTFPATVSIDDKGLTLKSEFTIDRTEFDMNYGTDKVEKEVALTIVIGEKTDPDGTELPTP